VDGLLCRSLVYAPTFDRTSLGEPMPGTGVRTRGGYEYRNVIFFGHWQHYSAGTCLSFFRRFFPLLSANENAALTQVGKGTPMGELMRRYWHPIAAVPELNARPTKAIRLLGEDLVLYKDRSGTLGLIDKLCAHRRVDLTYGIPEENGLRCMYHGWMFDETGQCIEQPFEETVHPDGRFKEKVKVSAYPVEAVGGLIFAYLGPQPTPLVPHWDFLVDEHSFRQVNILELPANWLQCQENSLDPVHLEWLHNYWSNYQRELAGDIASTARPTFAHEKIGFDIFDYGIIKRRVFQGYTEDDADWSVGHSVLFPNILANPTQFRVPIDDTHTLHLDYVSRRLPDDVPAPPADDIEVYHPPLYGEDGRNIINYTFGQDYMAWVSQGPVGRRDLEKLGESDKGIILFRKQLRDQMAIVEDGGDPMNVFRDPAENVRIELPNETKAVAKGMKSGRVQGNNRNEIPAWANPAPWAGYGMKYYVDRAYDEKEKAQ